MQGNTLLFLTAMSDYYGIALLCSELIFLAKARFSN